MTRQVAGRCSRIIPKGRLQAHILVQANIEVRVGRWTRSALEENDTITVSGWMSQDAAIGSPDVTHPGGLDASLLEKNDRSCYSASMTKAAAATRERILEQGLALMSRSGLSGVTLGLLADQAGMSKSGLFAHFHSKEEVQIGLLRHMAEFAQANVVQPAMRAEQGLPRLKALVRRWFGWAQRAGLPGGCPVAAGLFEFDDVEGAVRNQILAMEGEWRGLLKQLVQEAIDRGQFRRGLDVDQFIWELCGIYLSHHAAHRFLRAADADRRAATAFEALLGRARIARGKPRRQAT
jgi:AcrR family transcriptional regulator